nr:MAG: hypothetical protein 1 [Leviviridae sp.]
MSSSQNLTKTRTWYGNPVKGRTRSSGFASWNTYDSVGILNTESITGLTHSRRGTGWSGGGGMYLSRDARVYSGSPAEFKRFNAGGALLTEGTLRIEGPTVSILDIGKYDTPSDSELDALGTTAIARTEPLNPAFDLSVALGELMREGIPNVPGSSVMEQTRLAKKAGGEYLNVEFGWLPLVRSVRDFAQVVQKSDEIVRAHQENANIVIQRRYDWPTVSDWKWTPCSFSMQPAVGFFTGGGRHQSVRQDKWFEAEYIYHLPTGGSTNDKFRRYGSYARKLLGIDLSPEVLWNLSPWSWAADWFGNVGDVMHNISAIGTDGLVMRHGYVMCHTVRTTIDEGTAFGVHQSCRRTEETKVRRGATPYGFGLSYAGLSLRQKAILVAVGLSSW